MHSSLTLDSTQIVRTPAVVMRKGLPAKLALTDADDTRYDFRNLVVSNADGSPRGGVTAPVGTNLVTGTATMNVSVGAFAAVAVRDGGVILLANDGPVNVLIDAAPVSNSRWDLICARQDDASSTVTTPDADNLAKLYVVKGTAGATPAVPALPAGSVEVGRVQASAGDTNTNAMVIAQTQVYTSGVGGAIPFRTRGDLNAWTPGSDFGAPRRGQRAIVLADPLNYNDLEYVWDGSIWSPVPTIPQPVSLTAIAGAWTLGAKYRASVLGNKIVCHLLATKSSAIVAGETILTFPLGLRPFDDYTFPSTVVTGGYESNTYLVCGVDGVLKVGAITPNANARSIRSDFNFDIV